MKRVLLSFVAAIAASSAAMADDCAPLSVEATIPIHFALDGRPYVPVQINGVGESFLVDTGGVFTEIRADAADQLKLDSRQVPMELVGVSGDVAQRAASAQLQLGKITANGTDLFIMSNPGTLSPDIRDGVGVLAPNILTHFDADFDFGNSKLNLVSQKHCDGHVVYWSDTAVVVPFHTDAANHILLSVTLDGQNLNAMMDTGANKSFVNMTVAEGMGLLPGSDALTPVGTLADGNRATIYSHRFQSLVIQGIKINGPTMDVIPNLMTQHDPNFNSANGGTRIHPPSGLPDVNLGMDVLRKLHVYVAYKEHNLYITGANTQPAATGAK